MLKGTVTFRARINGNGLTFPFLDFNPNEPGVEKVELESPTGNEIVGTVHFASVSSEEDGKAIGAKVLTTALNRISFFHGIAIENAEIAGSQFCPLDPQPRVLMASVGTYALMGATAALVVGIPAERVKTELEQASIPGEQYFGLLRSARQSNSRVEEFMHLYHILLMFFEDDQAKVDTFVRAQKPDVPQTQHPHKKTGVMETVYTRLRNEFAHKRPYVNLDNTKAEMENRVGELAALAKRAIELNPY